MTLVSSPAFASDNTKQKSYRDDVRKRFYADLGLKPVKNLADISLSPSGQLGAVMGLISDTLGKGTADTSEALNFAKAQMARVGFCQGGFTAGLGSTKLDTKTLIPFELGKSFFNGG